MVQSQSSIRLNQNKEKTTMAQDYAKSFAEIVKFSKNDDGTLTVYGKATSDDLDIDLQICDNDWLKKAMPDWFKSGGNIREQHSSIAAGVATDYEEKGDGFYITANVVDPISCKKVEAKVLKGFSIGIKAPRVIRDEKAANGRIVDGQIVEVSLVDRPANPTCQLVLAKAVGGESTLTQVEEYTEQLSKGSAVSGLHDVILEIHEKAIKPNAVKFDQDSYTAAIRGIANLIITEANEMADQGSDERDDIETLLDALKHLFNFYDGEAEEGETPNNITDVLGLSAKASSADCTCDGCKDCKDAGGCDNDPCDKCMSVKSASISKCLECGCHQPTNAHGATQIVVPATGQVANVTTAATLDTSGSIKSAEGEEAAPAETPAPETLAEEVKAEAEKVEDKVEELIAEIKTEILDEKAVAAIVEKAVKSATEIVKTEIISHEAALKAASEKVVALESELATAKSAVLSGGPVKTGRKPNQDTNELLATAIDYRLKAAATTDPTLIKGYKALEAEYLEKASKLNK